AGLPGEWILIEDGDVYINGVLARKSLAEFKQVRILVFDNNFQPKHEGWRQRWEYKSGTPQATPEQLLVRADDADLNEEQESGITPRHLPPTTHHSPLTTHSVGKDLYLGAENSLEYYYWLTYRNFSLDQGKVLPIRDEYAYNGGTHRAVEGVHDFMLEC